MRITNFRYFCSRCLLRESIQWCMKIYLKVRIEAMKIKK
ncbi:hypothetical protein TFKS16_0827 [Tannerella forsythia KS16]|uniref:Uncharacterized protein n=1 Tax=Tannerella forsythia (strain ATCC 43037 / JCM 10827 / CCUG 21028 A / KCTC 5666 / FDC 338) TaxID=203275 RepID=G8UKM3_TANFA|nr:hypothetical protein BFO_1413 [Tannerella forsythia 92A2]BAR48821.1 hypothetical protein TF3313_1293 [Tannerella forsythia 3313]BAR51119.1 hypothetical protein TFKS16_0827 [Tannerella forsythia KS16]